VLPDLMHRSYIAVTFYQSADCRECKAFVQNTNTCCCKAAAFTCNKEKLKPVLYL